MTPERDPQPAGDGDAPMPAAVAPEGGDTDADGGAARIDDAVTQHSATPLPRSDDDLPPVPPGHPPDERS